MPMTDAQRAAKKRQKARRKERKRLARAKAEQARTIHNEAMYMTSPRMTARQFLKDSTR